MVNNKVKILYYLSLTRGDWDHLDNLNEDSLLAAYFRLVGETGTGWANNKKVMKHISKQLESIQ